MRRRRWRTAAMTHGIGVHARAVAHISGHGSGRSRRTSTCGVTIARLVEPAEGTADEAALAEGLAQAGQA